MARIECEVYEVEVEDENGRDAPGLCVECGACQHQVEVFGQGEPSLKRALATLRKECPEGERNFYVSEDDQDGAAHAGEYDGDPNGDDED
jgi:ferredoxin